MTTRTTSHLESLTYWLRLEDLVPKAGLGDRLIEQARQGLLLLQSDSDLTVWIQDSELLLRDIDSQLRRAGESGYPELPHIGRSAPAVDSLRALLTVMTRTDISAPRETASVG